MLVVMPWPDPRLSPNARLHWAVKKGVVKKARNDAAYLTYDAMPCGAKEVRQHFAGEGKIDVSIRFYPPDNLHRDADNMVAMIKHGLDGVADALGVNDRRFRPVFYFEDAAKPGRVEISLNPVENRDFGKVKVAKNSVNGVEQKMAERCANTTRPDPNETYQGGSNE